MSNSNTTGGIGFLGLLQICFIVLKLCKVITWSWIWVLSPTWLPIGFALFILLIVVFFMFLDDKLNRKVH